MPVGEIGRQSAARGQWSGSDWGRGVGHCGIGAVSTQNDASCQQQFCHEEKQKDVDERGPEFGHGFFAIHAFAKFLE